MGRRMSETVRGDVEIITFGCRLNAYESELIARKAAAAGLADAVIVNTCAVTAEAERQAASDPQGGAQGRARPHRHRLRGADFSRAWAAMPR